MNRYYTAYGSNLNIEQMSKRCPQATVVGRSEIKDHMLTYRGDEGAYYLTVIPMKGHTVPVGIWETSDKDELSLDYYEEYPTLYHKTEIELDVVHDDSGETTKEHCYIYIMNEDKHPGLPSERYVKTCTQGYKDFGFDVKVLEDALDSVK